MTRSSISPSWKGHVRPEDRHGESSMSAVAASHGAGLPLARRGGERVPRAEPGKLLNQGMIREKTPVITRHLHMLPSVYLDQFSPGKSLLMEALNGASEEMRERLWLRDDLPGQQDRHGRLQTPERQRGPQEEHGKGELPGEPRTGCGRAGKGHAGSGHPLLHERETCSRWDSTWSSSSSAGSSSF